jgi:hypothetical protein
MDRELFKVFGTFKKVKHNMETGMEYSYIDLNEVKRKL